MEKILVLFALIFFFGASQTNAREVIDYKAEPDEMKRKVEILSKLPKITSQLSARQLVLDNVIVERIEVRIERRYRQIHNTATIVCDIEVKVSLKEASRMLDLKSSHEMLGEDRSCTQFAVAPYDKKDVTGD